MVRVQDLPEAAPLLAAATATEPLEEPITIVAPTHNNQAFQDLSDELGEALDDVTPEIVLAVRIHHAGHLMHLSVH